MPRGATAAAILALLAGAAGCQPPPDVDPDAAPAGPYPIAVDPEPGSEGVVTDPVVRVEMSDHLSGRSIKRSRLSLASGGMSMWVMTCYDPVRRRLSVWPSARLRKNATWVFSFDEGMKGLDGEEVPAGEVTRFRTGEEPGDNSPFKTYSYERDVKPIFEERCASCHGGAGAGLAGLRLDTAEAVGETALGVRSTGWPDWSRIVPARPSESYLLYKIIGDPRVAGTAMPRGEGLEDAPPLTRGERELVSDWIASGAAFF